MKTTLEKTPKGWAVVESPRLSAEDIQAITRTLAAWVSDDHSPIVNGKGKDLLQHLSLGWDDPRIAENVEFITVDCNGDVIGHFFTPETLVEFPWWSQSEDVLLLATKGGKSTWDEVYPDWRDLCWERPEKFSK